MVQSLAAQCVYGAAEAHLRTLEFGPDSISTGLESACRQPLLEIHMHIKI